MLIKKTIKRIIPQHFHFFLAEAKNLLTNGYCHCHYSQFGEDLIIKSITKNKNKGFYVDVGAHHPFRYSNTRLLYKRGWRGINVEPNHYTIKLFRIFRRRDINLEIGVGSEDGVADYYYFSDPAYNTFSREQMEESLKNNKWLKLKKKVNLSISTLKTILTKYLPAGVPVDFLNVDVEGLDMVVLLSNDWEKFKPRIISVESPNFDLDRPNEDETYNYLKNLGYKLEAVTGCSLIFVLYS